MLVKALRAVCTGMKNSYLLIGRILYTAEAGNMKSVRLEDGFERDLMSWAEEEFKLKKSALYAASRAYVEYCIDDRDELEPIVKPEYARYSQSQLVEILPIPHELRSGVNPDMTVKEIRKYKQDHKEKKKQPEPEQIEIPSEQLAPIEITEEDASESKDKCTTTILANLKQRQEWLGNYRAWGAWLRVPQLGMTYYRYDFGNGDSVIVTEVERKNSVYNVKGYDTLYHLLVKEGYRSDFHPGGNAASEITDYLQKNRPTVIVYPKKEGDAA